jgi:glycosyltransferase involved in cell wall biosynthesis
LLKIIHHLHTKKKDNFHMDEKSENIMRKSVCIISLSQIAADSRVLRQVEYLSKHYNLTVIGYGPPPPGYATHGRITWCQLKLPRQKHLKTAASVCARLLLIPILPRVHAASRLAIDHTCDAYLANNWDALPAAALAARANRAKLILDLHESFDAWYWGLSKGIVSKILMTYAKYVTVSTTVVQPLANQHRAFGLTPVVLRNIPSFPKTPVRFIKTGVHQVRLVHHGVAAHTRRSDLMIRALAHCDARYELHLIFINHISRYVRRLRRLAEKIAPGRVFFHPPLQPMEIVKGIAQYDIGFFPLPPTNYNYRIALPNKLYEFIAAGLAVCIGPSPSMAEVVNQYGCGVVAPSFEPEVLAELLNRTTAAQWDEMKQASHLAATELNADNEMGKMLDIFWGLLDK